jgi:hypothetical protein
MKIVYLGVVLGVVALAGTTTRQAETAAEPATSSVEFADLPTGDRMTG